MKIGISAYPGNKPVYSFEDMDEDTVKLVSKALYTNFLQNNFKDDIEEELCEIMLSRLAGILPDDRHILV